MRCLSIFVLCVIPAIVQAQVAAGPEVNLPTHTVVGQKSQSSFTAPAKLEALQMINQAPGGVSIIDAEDYLKGRASTLKDMLDYAPGVFVQSRFGAEEARISIRGSGIQRTFHGRGLKILQDGMPINDNDGSFDMQAVEPLAQQYLEVYRGANALAFGSSTLGGAVNFVSHTGRDASPLQIRGEYGSFGYGRAQVSSGYAVGPVDYYLTLTHFRQEGFRDHAEQDNQRLYANLGYQIAQNIESRFYLTLVNSDSALPGSLTKRQIENTPSQANPGNLALNQRRDRYYARVGNRTVVQGDHSRINFTTYWNYHELDHPIFQVIDQTSNNFGGMVDFTHEGELFGHRNDIVAGLHIAAGHVNNKQYQNLGGNRGNLTVQGIQESRLVEAWAENQFYVLPQVALIAGGQFTWADRDFEDQFLTDGDQSDLQTYYQISPKAGVRWDVTEETQVFANFSRSFEPPTWGELSNIGGNSLLQLNAQQAWTFEIGTRGRHSIFEWDAAFYYSWIDNELLAFNVETAPNVFVSRTINAEDTFHRGVELGLAITLFEGLYDNDPLGLGTQREGKDRIVLRTAALWNDFRFNSDKQFGDNRLAGIPQYTVKAMLEYEHPTGFYFGPNMEFASRAPVDMANDLYADEYVIWGFRVGYRTRKGFTFFVEGRNLSDEHYAATTGVITSTATPTSAAQFLPGDGRSCYFGAELKF